MGSDTDELAGVGIVDNFHVCPSFVRIAVIYLPDNLSYDLRLSGK